MYGSILKYMVCFLCEKKHNDNVLSHLMPKGLIHKSLRSEMAKIDAGLLKAKKTQGTPYMRGILCTRCEGASQKYDDYFIKNLIHKIDDVFKIEILKGDNGKKYEYIVSDTLNKEMIRKFILITIFRFHFANKKTKKVGRFDIKPKHLKALKVIYLEKDSMNAANIKYSTTLKFQHDFIYNKNPQLYYSKEKGKHSVSLTLPEHFKVQSGKHNSISFTIGPYIFNQYITSHEPIDFKNFNLGFQDSKKLYGLISKENIFEKFNFDE